LGDLVYLELPAMGRKLAAAEACAVVESVKAASDVYAPVAGEVVDVNTEVAERTRKGERGSVRVLALPDEACRRRRGGEAPRRPGLRGDDRRRVMSVLEPSVAFVARHIGTAPTSRPRCSDVLGYRSRAALMDAIVPATIRRRAPLGLPAALTEAERSRRSVARGEEQGDAIVHRPGYYGTHTPGVILRNVLENPAWYTRVHAVPARDLAGAPRSARPISRR
jgi:hypothetical protein